MSTLIQSLNSPKKAKAAFQTYVLEHGIEKLSVLVPLASAPDFETAFNSQKDLSKQAVLKLVESFDGRVR